MSINMRGRSVPHYTTDDFQSLYHHDHDYTGPQAWQSNHQNYHRMIEISDGGPKIKDFFALIVRLMKWKYSLPDNQKLWEQVSLDSTANEI